MSIHTTVQQMGVEVKTSFAGTMDSKKYYDRSTGILIREEGDILAEGKAGGMGQQIPIKAKAHIKMTVK